jgi:hypothetical protein
MNRNLVGSTWVILWQLFKIPSFVYVKEKFVTNISFATVRLINHSWNRIKCFASCFIKNYIFFYVFYTRGVAIFFLQSQYLKQKDHSFAWKSIATPKNETNTIHFCHVFVVIVPWRMQNFPARFKRDTRLVKGWNDICWDNSHVWIILASTYYYKKSLGGRNWWNKIGFYASISLSLHWSTSEGGLR